jgi:hypothetical protein
MVSSNKFVVGYWTEFDENKFQPDVYYLIWYEYDGIFDIIYALYDFNLQMWKTRDNRVIVSSKAIRYISNMSDKIYSKGNL